MLAALSLDADGSDQFWSRYFGQISLDNAVVFDPFVGGGTSAVEASRCNARVVGYDIDPVATYITRFELESSVWNRLPASVEAIAEDVSTRVLPLHRTTLQNGIEADVLHHFWVEVTACQRCGHKFEIHPHHLLAYDPAKKRQWAFCRACHEVGEQRLGAKVLACGCGVRTVVHEGPLAQGKLTCPDCGVVHDLADRGRETKRPPVWRLFAQEYVEPGSKGTVRKFKKATDADRTRYRKADRFLKQLEERGGSFAPPAGDPGRWPVGSQAADPRFSPLSGTLQRPPASSPDLAGQGDLGGGR